MPLATTLGFIGAGKMATALAQGFIAADLASGKQIWAADPIAEASLQFASAAHSQAAASNREVIEKAETIFLAVKPQNMPAVLAELKSCLTARHLVISIAAGISLKTLEQGLGENVRVVRVMPNTPCLVGQGASAFALGSRASAEDAQLVMTLLKSVGVAYQVEEKLLDAVTGLSGSGPAFVYIVIEALSDGGVRMGLPRDVASALAAQTVLGSAAMVLQTGLHPAVLKDQVTSPGGTTIAGIQALENLGLRSALIAAVEAATKRSVELGGPK